MGDTSKIEWTDHTFNPWLGCSKVHAGCTNCYAETHQAVAMRQGGKIRWGEPWQGGQRVVVADSTWAHPLTWARKAAKAGERHRVFCASLADVLEVPAFPPNGQRTPENTALAAGASAMLDAARARLWDTIRKTARVWPDGTSVPGGPGLLNFIGGAGVQPTPGLDWLLLTKRPENWRLVPEDVRPLVWLGTSISDQETADEWVPRLLAAQGFRYRFLSVEPLVGPVDLARWVERIDHCTSCGAENPPQGPDRCPECGGTGTLISTWGLAEAERYRTGERYSTEEGQRDVDGKSLGLDWVIVGGESGRKARPCNVGWLQSIMRQCREAGIAAFCKQLGSNPVYDGNFTPSIPVDTRDHKGGDMAEWPEDLRVRQFPGAT